MNISDEVHQIAKEVKRFETKHQWKKKMDHFSNYVNRNFYGNS